MKILTSVISLLILSNSLVSISAQSNKTFFLGHSLTNFEIPNMVDKLSDAGSQSFSYDANIGIGATLSWHWASPSSGQGSQWDLTLPLGGYENFIITEAVPLNNHLQFSNTYRYVDSLYRFAQQYNPNIQYYIYETWHCTYSGNGSTSGSNGYPCDWDPNSNTPWRDRIDIDLHRWESIADSINLLHVNPMLVIPAGQALGRLDDHIRGGNVPGLNSVFDLFVDEYHLDSRGNYFIACVMYSVIHGVSPVGLPNHVTNRFGSLYSIFPTPTQAIEMQKIAWKTVCDYQRDGVDCEVVSVTNLDNDKSILNIYPNPTDDYLMIELNEVVHNIPYTIYDQLGKIILKGDLNSQISKIEVADLPHGLYFFTTKSQTVKFTK